MTLRVLPAVEERVETGSVQFGDDWPGIFIRGDNAAWYAMNLQEIVKKIAPNDFMAKACVEGLLNLLTGSNVSYMSDEDRQLSIKGHQ